MKFYKIAVFVLTFITATTFAQENKKLTTDKYNSIKDSLVELKSNLIDIKEELNSELDSLKSYSENLDNELQTALYDHYVEKYGQKIGARIHQGRVWKGMTDEMLKDSWGKPDKIDKNVQPWGVFTQWYYGDITYFFKNGVMTGWEEK